MARKKTAGARRLPDSSNSTPDLTVISVDRLDFDARNPRIVEFLGTKPTQKQILDVLLAEMEARELVPSFMTNGYLPYEPLIVRPERKGRHVVMEGNRRLAALLSMRDSDDPEEKEAFYKKRLAKVPCLIFEGDQAQEIAYLGLRHLSKTKDWSASAKAAFVERLLQSSIDLSEAADIVNTSRNALRQLLVTRRLFEKASELGIDLPSSSKAEGELLFWHLGDAVRRTNTKRYLQIMESDDPLRQPEVNESRFENLIGWIYGNPKTREARLIRSIRDIPSLDKCLGHPKSTEALERGASIEEAEEEAQAAGYTVSSHLDRAKKSVQKATAGVSDVQEEGEAEVKQARDALEKAILAFDKAFKADSEK